MRNGSFLVFRKLQQDVDGWNDMLRTQAGNLRNGGKAPWTNITDVQLGAMIMGRYMSGNVLALVGLTGYWLTKSGCPVVSSVADNPDMHSKNDFLFNSTTPVDNSRNSICPLGAHIRKMNPRDPTGNIKAAPMIRHGIPYGDEGKDPRGLLFVSYQSDLKKAFHFVQSNWANNVTFPPVNSAHDLVSGNPASDKTLSFMLSDATGTMTSVTPTGSTVASVKALNTGINPFVRFKGGEYFFSPSFDAMTSKFGSG
jgi:Dyp-type peroxidase family